MAEQFLAGKEVEITDIALIAYDQQTREDFSGKLTILRSDGDDVTLSNRKGKELKAKLTYLRKP